MRPAPRQPSRDEMREGRAARAAGKPNTVDTPGRQGVLLSLLVVGGLAAIALVVFLRARPVPDNKLAAGTAAKPADQVRTEEIVKANAGLPSDPALASEYQAINTQYFEGRLPAVRLRWESRLDEVGPMIADGFRMNGVTDGQLILLNPAIQADRDEFRRVLCHEIVHIAVVAEPQPHGPAFQAYLKLLLAKGAFRGIVATDQEKRDRRLSLDRKNADLVAEADLLAREKAGLEAEAQTGQTRAEDLATRTAQYNDRVRRHNDAVVEFNHSVDEYNQTVTYPDGLDRERMSRSTSVPGSL